MTDGDSMTINNLRDSANGTFVTLDDSSHFTGYEPNAMELNDTELNDSVPSNFTDFQDSTTTWMTRHSASYSQKYTEITPITPTQ